MALQRRQKASAGDTSSASMTGCGDSLGLFSRVLEFLSMSAWEDGTSRVTGTAMILTEGGRWKVWLHDRDAMDNLWVSGKTLDEALMAAESALEAGEGDWRPDKGKQDRGGGRRS